MSTSRADRSGRSDGLKAALFDAMMSCGTEANLAKLLAREANWNAAEACMQTFGRGLDI